MAEQLREKQHRDIAASIQYVRYEKRLLIGHSRVPARNRIEAQLQNQLLAAAGALQLRLLPVELAGKIELLARLVLLS